MEVYRISKKEFASLDGVGGLYYPGRWHEAGYRVIYASQHRSLAALEYLCHLSKTNFLLSDYVITYIDIPDDEVIENIRPEKLQKYWYSMNKIVTTREIGTKFLKKNDKLALKVPSAIIPQEWNFIVNPAHKAFYRCVAKKVEIFNFDGRLVK